MSWILGDLRLRSSSISMLLCIAVVAAEADAKSRVAVSFGTLPVLWNVQLSPDGSKISLLQMHADDFPIAVVFDFAKSKPNLVLASPKDRFDLSWCRWANNERLLCGFRGVATERHRQYGVTRLVAVNADGSEMKVLMQERLRKTFAQFQDDIVDWLPDDPKHVLIEEPSSGGSGVAKLNVYSGKVDRETRPRSGVREWVTDGRGNLRLRFKMTEREKEWEYRLAGEEKWRPLHQSEHTNLEAAYIPIGFGDDPNRLLVLKSLNGRLALWSEDLSADRASSVVFAHPEVDVEGALRLGKFRRVVAVGFSTDRQHLHFFDADVEQITDRIDAEFANQEVQVVDESWDRRFYIVHVGGDRNPGELYRLDVGQNQLVKISPQYPELDGLTLAAMEPIRYEARDGTEIPGYLTVPTGTSEGNLPAVVLPHGGPQARDYWGYDWLAQFFAARGYAVLQSNYRGSGGFGADWSGKGGFRDWRQAIDDITDGALHLVKTGVADAQRLCIVGWSYGGYAALMSAVEEPDLYRCVVSIAGVTDLPMLAEDRRHFLGWKGAREFIGRDQEVLEGGSPLRRVEEIKVPVLLFHGDEDVNVRVDHSQKMAKELKRKKKQVEYIEYEEAEHRIFRNRFRVDMLDRIGAFLDNSTLPRKPAK